MKANPNQLTFEKLSESNPKRREGEIHVAQVISVPQPATATLRQNAVGTFLSDENTLRSRMKDLSKRTASIKIA